ncbi:hypothetical protein V1477_020644 [Vespula maculifrons]|uniref:Uncharacterized protein n=1 Tax=Vespula maculifrons TaxID=7453 RepID=A0ABD2AMJ1_VESMC
MDRKMKIGYEWLTASNIIFSVLLSTAERFLSSQTCLIAFEGEKVVLVVGVAPTITIYCNMILCSTRSMTGYYPHAAPQDFHIAGNVVLSEIGRIITCLILNIAVTML